MTDHVFEGKTRWYELTGRDPLKVFFCTHEMRLISPKGWMALNRSDFDFFTWSTMSKKHLKDVSVGAEFWRLHFNFPDLLFDRHYKIKIKMALGSSLLPDGLMVRNNSQDENIPIFAQVWPWSLSRELSVRPYFGTYLQTSMWSLFRPMFFSLPFGKSSWRLGQSQSLRQTFVVFEFMWSILTYINKPKCIKLMSPSLSEQLLIAFNCRFVIARLRMCLMLIYWKVLSELWFMTAKNR